MLGEIMIGILGLFFLTGAIMQFQCKGPVWSAEYVAASPENRKKMRTRQEYYWTGAACLWIGLLFILTMIYSLSQVTIFLYILFGLSFVLFVHILYGIFRAIRKSTHRDRTDIKKKRSKNGGYEK